MLTQKFLCSFPIRGFYNDELVNHFGSKEAVEKKLTEIFAIAQANFLDPSLNVSMTLSFEILYSNVTRDWKADGNNLKQIRDNREIDFDSNVQAHVVFALDKGEGIIGISTMFAACIFNASKRLNIVEYRNDFEAGWVSLKNIIS